METPRHPFLKTAGPFAELGSISRVLNPTKPDADARGVHNALVGGALGAGIGGVTAAHVLPKVKHRGAQVALMALGLLGGGALGGAGAYHLGEAINPPTPWERLKRKF